MEIELHIEELETERRWNRLEAFREEGVLGRFLAYRDDQTFIWLRQGGQAGVPVLHLVRDTVVRLRPAAGSTVTEPAHFARMTEPLLELRQYRVVPGVRSRFAEFLRDRSYEEHVRLGMPVYGPFESLDDENVIVWFRGFSDLQQRDRVKAQFYQGALWVNELEAIAMPMIEDYKNVMLVTPVR